MKIGLVSGEFPPLEGGVGAFTQELARALYELNHEVHIISNRETRPDSAERTWRTRNDPVNLGFAALHPRIERWRWPSLTTVVDIVIRQHLEIVNIQYQAAAYNMNSAAINMLPWRLKGVTTSIVTFHDLRVPYLFPKAGFLRRTAVNFLARQANGVITTNHDDFETLQSRIKSPAAEIPIGSNISTYSPNHIEISEVREKLGLKGNDFLLGYFGFLNESKGADVLLSALKNLDSRFNLVFIGGQTGTSDSTNAAFLDQMKNQIGNWGLTERVHWTGFLSDVRVSTFLHAADLMVMPYRDGVSLRRGTLMAILAHGRPLITTAPETPTPELEHGTNVWFMPPNDINSLIQAIQTLADDPTLRQTLGRQAEKISRQFTWDKIASQTAAFYKQVLAEGDNSAK